MQNRRLLSLPLDGVSIPTQSDNNATRVLLLVRSERQAMPKKSKHKGKAEKAKDHKPAARLKPNKLPPRPSEPYESDEDDLASIGGYEVSEDDGDWLPDGPID
jgi:hypothetical protein